MAFYNTRVPRKPQAPTPVPAPAASRFNESDSMTGWGEEQEVVATEVDPAQDMTGRYGETEDATAQYTTAVPMAVSSHNVLNSDVSVKGIIRFTDDLLIDGYVEGEITSDGVLTVGENATIEAGESNKVAIKTQSAIIRGRVTGDVEVTDRVDLSSSAVLVGNVKASKISIQEGATFVGYCNVGDTAGLTPQPAPAPSTPARKKSAAKADANLLD